MCLYKVVTGINDVYGIQRNPRSRFIVVHLCLLVHYQGRLETSDLKEGVRGAVTQ
jgi:hypothetical protein